MQRRHRRRQISKFEPLSNSPKNDSSRSRSRSGHLIASCYIAYDSRPETRRWTAHSSQFFRVLLCAHTDYSLCSESISQTLIGVPFREGAHATYRCNRMLLPPARGRTAAPLSCTIVLYTARVITPPHPASARDHAPPWLRVGTQLIY